MDKPKAGGLKPSWDTPRVAPSNAADCSASSRPAVEEAQSALLNDVHRVYFRAGLLACREYMARFVEVDSTAIAESIRANWWPHLGADPGPPRLLDFSELAEGGQEGPWKPKEDVSPSVEALPIAAQFLLIR